MTYREIIYMCLDLLKIAGDDSYFTEDHIRFLCNKYRVFLLKQKYSDIKKLIPTSNYLTICLNLSPTKGIQGIDCTNTYLKTTLKLPNMLTVGNPTISLEDYYIGNNISFINKNRMKFVGNNKYLQNIIYCSLNVDGCLYLTSANSLFVNLEKINITGIFEDNEKASMLECLDEEITTLNCDIMDKTFPLEDSLVNQLILAVVLELTGATYKPKDDSNNDNDDLARLAYFLSKNLKSDLTKKIEG